jgi:4-hydroxybenzoate polyprenyltransferase
LIITSLLGFLEWGGNNRSFLFQVEATLLLKIFTDPASVMHPLTILPLLGQIVLVATLFQRTPNKKLSYIGIGCLGILLGWMFVIGWVSLNFKIILSTIPFLVFAIFTIRNYRENK